LTKNRLIDFLIQKYKLKDIPIREINTVFLQDSICSSKLKITQGMIMSYKLSKVESSLYMGSSLNWRDELNVSKFSNTEPSFLFLFKSEVSKKVVVFYSYTPPPQNIYSFALLSFIWHN